MEEFLKEHLISSIEKTFDDDWTSWRYHQSINPDALTREWLDNRTSYIYKVGVLCAIDANKCDWVHVVIGVQRNESSPPEVKGMLYFDEGENDDIGRVMKRAVELMAFIHPAMDAE